MYYFNDAPHSVGLLLLEDKSMTSKVTLNPETVTELCGAIRSVIRQDNKRESASELLLTKTESIVTVAVAIGTLEAWDIYRSEIDRMARVSKRAAKSLGYFEKIVTVKGSDTLRVVPRQTLQNIFSVIRQSLKHSVPLADAKGNARSFNAIKSEKDKAATKARKAAMTDRAKDIEAIAAMFQACLTNLKNVDSDADIHALKGRVLSEVVPMFPTATKAA